MNSPQLKKKTQDPISAPKCIKNSSHQIISTNPAISNPPIDITKKYLNSTLENIDVNSLTVKREEEWKKIETDTSKLYKHCLMLSKIRLTCKLFFIKNIFNVIFF